MLGQKIAMIYKKQLDNIFARLEALENKDVSEDTTEPIEYPEYVQPTGSHDSYNTGDKVTYNGKKYTCVMDNCAWSPDTYPAGWEEVVEEEKATEVAEGE